eukprot:11376196-Alexandrium_andersonii.AAC.1
MCIRDRNWCSTPSASSWPPVRQGLRERPLRHAVEAEPPMADEEEPVSYTHLRAHETSAHL